MRPSLALTVSMDFRLDAGEAPVASIMLLTALDLFGALEEGARPGDASDALFQCYDATLQRQGIGRRITIEDELANPACVDIIRQQRELLNRPSAA